MSEPPWQQRVIDLADSLRFARADLDRLLDGVRAANNALSGGAEPLEVVGAGALVHSYYTNLERLFERVASDLDASPTEGPDWSRRLLRAMGLDKPGVRPPLLDAPLADKLLDLLLFRQRFREGYVIDLDPARVVELLERIVQIHPEVIARIQAFETFLGALAEQ